MLALESHPAARRPAAPGRETRTARDTSTDDVLVCARCQQLVTTARQRREMLGSHTHRFMNPGGFLYEIGCFSEAVGCVPVGPTSSEYPWFPGYAWRCVHCGTCASQLGWHFRNSSGGFFGLILDRLTARPADPG